MSQSADRDDVDTGFGDLTDRLQRDSTGRFEQRSPIRDRHSFGHQFGVTCCRA